MTLRHEFRAVLFLLCLVAGFVFSRATPAAINIPAAKISAFFTAVDLGSSAPGAGGKFDLNGQMAYGGGILFGFGIVNYLEAEIGYIGTIQSHSSVTNPSYYIEWPLMLRVPLGKVFSIGAGAYGLDTLGTGWGIGAAGSVRVSLALSEKVAVMLEGRYRYGLASITLPSGSKFDDVAFDSMLGFTFKL